MSILKKISAFIAFFALSVSMQALNLPVRHVNGKAYYVYTVDKKDRFYQLPEKLGVTRSDITKYNPQTTDGIHEGMVLMFPVEIDAVISNGFYITSYVAGKDESVYGVAKRFDIPVDRLVQFNPQANQGVRGIVLTIPLIEAPAVGETMAMNSPEDGSEVRYHIIAKGETLTRIAAKYNVRVADLLLANPGLDASRYAAGQKIKIPFIAEVEKETPAVAVEEIKREELPESIIPERAETVRVAFEAKDSNSILPEPIAEQVRTATVAIMLPFMANEETPSKAAQLNMEFYRGFLLGSKNFVEATQYPVKIYAYDTYGSVDSLRSILSLPEITSTDVIIAPDGDENLDLVANNAVSRNAFVLNSFAVKNELYTTNPSVIQTNIPHKYMYQKAIYGFHNKFKGYVPVFLSRIDGNADKAEFVTELKTSLTENAIEFKDIAFRNFLSLEDLEQLPTDSAYVFIPVSGSRIEFNKIAPALKTFRQTLDRPSEISLFGYPEWVTFRGDQLDHLCDLNAVIYSRFFLPEESPLANMIENEYKNGFNCKPMDAVPNQSLLGYDTAVFLLNSLMNNEGDFNHSSFDYDGIQSGFSLGRPYAVAGLVNMNLYFVNFRPGKVITKVQIDDLTREENE